MPKILLLLFSVIYRCIAIPTIYADVTKHRREVVAHSLVLKTGDGQQVSTGLAYFKTGDDPNDFYSPLHLASQEALLGFGWRNEGGIRQFLQLLASVSPSPDYWHNPDRLASIEQFPGGFTAIFEFCEQSRSG